MKAPKKLAGMWRITETEVWDEEALDLVVPAHLTIDGNGLGSLQMVAVQGDIDCRFEGYRVEFSWVGDDDGSEASGRGWAEIAGDPPCADELLRSLHVFPPSTPSVWESDDSVPASTRAGRPGRGRRNLVAAGPGAGPPSGRCRPSDAAARGAETP